MDSSPVLEIDESGDKVYRLNGRLHRTDGPAIELEDGSKFWYSNNQLHREYGDFHIWDIVLIVMLIIQDFVRAKFTWMSSTCSHSKEYTFEE